MGICTKRNFLMSICLLQLITAVERQVFDFLGYMWIPILANFFEIIFVIFGFFGGCQYRPKYLITYSIWSVLWLGWNTFLICLFLDIGSLDHKKSKILKLDPDSTSWWEINGPGCKVTYNTTASVPKLESVTGCVLNYTDVEIFHAGIQCILAVFGAITGIYLSKIYLEEDDSSAHNVCNKSKKRTSLYSIEFSPQHEIRQPDNDIAEEQLPMPMSPKPMTPRRVKRRSVMTRGSSGRHSTSSRRHLAPRSSVRSSRRTSQNPVTRIIEQQQQQNFENSTPSRPTSEPLPVYFNSSSSNNLVSPQEQQWQVNGHTNPTFQQSSTQSLNEQEDLDDLYNSRPASVRSSYSNFHGTRAISYGAPQYYHSYATPQVPQKRSTSHPPKQPNCSVAFLNNGPPAYTTQRQNSVDSETTI